MQLKCNSNEFENLLFVDVNHPLYTSYINNQSKINLYINGIDKKSLKHKIK